MLTENKYVHPKREFYYYNNGAKHLCILYENVVLLLLLFSRLCKEKFNNGDYTI